MQLSTLWAETPLAAIAIAVLGAVVLGAAAWVATPRVRTLAGPGATSRWLRRRTHVVLAAVAGASLPWLDLHPVELATLAIVAVLVALLVTVDLAVHRLPDALAFPTAGLLVLGWFIGALVGAGSWSDLGRAVLAALAVGSGLLVLCLLTPSGLGLGDAKLGAVLALALGWFGWTPVVGAVVLAFLLGGLFAVGLLLTRRATRRTAVAFGPWLAAGAALALALGDRIAGGT
ncbi:prepilin peptidase [Ruania alba]|uniref:Type IV leader peptidase family protein n=1 Tax=Ruania alba TaxID=648782 RepID=A0A1H5FTZ9_9MICO|nr:A24 family peptidase [Ruania alba]SEE06368.1 Type IV leader peptidase family protein [Ruania alba]